VLAPSSYVEKADIEAACAFMIARGFEVFVHPQTYERHGQMAGHAAQKIDALHDLYRDDSIDIIWAAGGGNRALSIIDNLDYDLIRTTPKPMIGFSDVTALLNAVTVKTGIVNIHGPVFKNLPKHQELDALLSHTFDMDLRGCDVVRSSEATGVLFGGNLSVFQYLLETLSGDWLNGAILFLEDCNEEISRIDRMFLHLKRAGVLNQIGALMLGEFSDMGDGARPFGLSLEDIVREHCDGLDIPIIMNVPFGHGANLHALPIGARARINQTDLKIL